jgi:hypothetical protein
MIIGLNNSELLLALSIKTISIYCNISGILNTIPLFMEENCLTENGCTLVKRVLGVIHFFRFTFCSCEIDYLFIH